MNAGTRRLTPGIVFLAIALVGSLLFVAYAVNVRDASQIPLLAAGGAAVGIAFIALAAYSLRAVWRAGLVGRNGRAIGLAHRRRCRRHHRGRLPRRRRDRIPRLTTAGLSPGPGPGPIGPSGRLRPSRAPIV